MTLEERIRELERQVEDIRHATDIEHVESLRRNVFPDVINTGTVDNPGSLNESTVLGPGGGTVAHAEEYDKRVLVRINNTPYYIGVYFA